MRKILLTFFLSFTFLGYSKSTDFKSTLVGKEWKLNSAKSILKQDSSIQLNDKKWNLLNSLFDISIKFETDNSFVVKLMDTKLCHGRYSFDSKQLSLTLKMKKNQR